ncbi:MAG: S-methyl-5-thioribose-1-phosphate isomerase [Anaerohalosphaeraceae bacterium]|nr:S-methyl-5-thioribose-1-phosphate isomerase [Anaerohalosphaeraceae bacterium]
MKSFKTLEWIGGIDGFLELTDQRKLPGEFIKLPCKTVEQLYDAIKMLAVRGAPAIGVAAGFGVCIAAREIDSEQKLCGAIEQLNKKINYLSQSRPTAVNLFWALDRMKTVAEKFAAQNNDATILDLRRALLSEAQKIYDEDVEMCRLIGINGEKFIIEGCAILTHCNAGALATAGQGTALSPIFEAAKNGKKFKVYADETRPLLQGARLTAWELKQSNMDVTLICDNMAGWLMKNGKIDAVITGADRIAANGDAANKIGTYGLSILAKAHNIPFYIAAPSSTFDLSIKTGSEIPIEQRDSSEVACFAGIPTAPKGIDIFNPAFDVTNAENITAIITEKGVIENPNPAKVKNILDTD